MTDQLCLLFYFQETCGLLVMFVIFIRSHYINESCFFIRVLKLLM